MEATKRPWKLINETRNALYQRTRPGDYQQVIQRCRYIAGPEHDSHFVADLITSNHDEGDANAELIVQAVNSHDKLVHALQDLLDWPALSQCVDTRVTTARAVLDGLKRPVSHYDGEYLP